MAKRTLINAVIGASMAFLVFEGAVASSHGMDGKVRDAAHSQIQDPQQRR